MRRLSGILMAVCVAGLTGCAGYKLGPSNGLAAGEKSVQFIPFQNRTLEPRLSDAVTAALRKELQREGTYRLVTREPGDIIVSGTITQYDRAEQTLLPSDVITARDYQLRMTAQVTARELLSGKVILERSVTGLTLARVDADFPSAERQALPLLATDLAKRVTALLADGSW